MNLTKNRDGVWKGRPRSQGEDLPIALKYQVSILIGAVKRPTEQAYFQNPYRAPMWVDEFHFGIENNENVLPNMVFAMRMKINGQYIVDDYVPLTLLGPHTDITENTFSGLSFFWRLAKPMWLDELDDVSIELTWLGDLDISATGFQTNPIDLIVTMCGRSTLSKNRPAERALPFNTVWGPLAFTSTIGSETSLISPDNALRNGKNTPVTVTRIFGSTFETQSAGHAGIIVNSDLLLNLRISHSLGYYLVKDLTPFFELFQNVSRAADVKFVLNPKEFITIELLTKTITLVDYPETTQQFQYFTGFALQGYYMEKLR